MSLEPLKKVQAYQLEKGQKIARVGLIVHHPVGKGDYGVRVYIEHSELGRFELVLGRYQLVHIYA